MPVFAKWNHQRPHTQHPGRTKHNAAGGSTCDAPLKTRTVRRGCGDRREGCATTGGGVVSESNEEVRGRVCFSSRLAAAVLFCDLVCVYANSSAAVFFRGNVFGLRPGVALLHPPARHPYRCVVRTPRARFSAVERQPRRWCSISRHLRSRTSEGRRSHRTTRNQQWRFTLASLLYLHDKFAHTSVQSADPEARSKLGAVELLAPLRVLAAGWLLAVQSCSAWRVMVPL